VKFLAAITAASRIKAKLAALAAGFTAQKPPRARFCAKFAIFLAQVKGTMTRRLRRPSFVYYPAAAGYRPVVPDGERPAAWFRHAATAEKTSRWNLPAPYYCL
jgi:hypothetical protein